MSDINIRDSVYQAIEEYNNVARREHCKKVTDDERRGLFYTILRRHIIDMTKERTGLRVDDFVCTFKENGEIKSFKIKKSFYDSWGNSYGVHLQELKVIGEEHKVLYHTPLMNEIASIVNKIK